MPTLFPLQVSPTIPTPLGRLGDLSQNFLFSWSPTTGQLFRRLDGKLWRRVEGNPKLFLRCVDQGILQHAAEDPDFLATYGRVVREFDEYLSKPVKQDGLEATDLIAYFCAEFGLHESFRSIRAASACSRATTAKQRVTFGCRSWPWACSTGRVTSRSGSIATATRFRRIRRSSLARRR